MSIHSELGVCNAIVSYTSNVKCSLFRGYRQAKVCISTTDVSLNVACMQNRNANSSLMAIALTSAVFNSSIVCVENMECEGISIFN